MDPRVSMLSPSYIQLRPIRSHSTLLGDIGRALADLIVREVPAANAVVGIPMAGIPIAVPIALASELRGCYTRPFEAEDRGEHSLVEGILRDNDRLVLVDDVVTRFDTKAKSDSSGSRRGQGAINRRYLHDVAVVIDRAQGGDIEARRVGCQIHSLLKLDELNLGIGLS